MTHKEIKSFILDGDFKYCDRIPLNSSKASTHYHSIIVSTSEEKTILCRNNGIKWTIGNSGLCMASQNTLVIDGIAKYYFYK